MWDLLFLKLHVQSMLGPGRMTSPGCCLRLFPSSPHGNVQQTQPHLALWDSSISVSFFVLFVSFLLWTWMLTGLATL